MYGPKNKGDLNSIDAHSFFLSLKISLVKKYALDNKKEHLDPWDYGLSKN